MQDVSIIQMKVPLFVVLPLNFALLSEKACVAFLSVLQLVPIVSLKDISTTISCSALPL